MNKEFFLQQIRTTKAFLEYNNSKKSFLGKGTSALVQINKDLGRTYLPAVEKKEVVKELVELREFVMESLKKFEEQERKERERIANRKYIL